MAGRPIVTLALSLSPESRAPPHLTVPATPCTQSSTLLGCQLGKLRRRENRRSRGDELRGLQAFWTTLAFHLARPPFGYGSGVVGLFGLVGIVRALAAPLVGRFADRRSPRWTIGAGLACILLSYTVLYESGGTVCGMVVGVILLDLGAQSAHVSNQSRIYAIRPEARSRMNTAYMVAYFVGGARAPTVGRGAGAGRVGAGSAWWAWAMTVAGLLAFVATAGVRLSGDPISIGGP